MIERPIDDGDTVEDLTRAEHLLVWAMRAIALGHEDCPTVIRAFHHLCGPFSAQTLQTHVIFVKYLALASRHRLQVHVPGCLCVGADEAAALAVVSAAQQSLRDGREDALRAAISELTGAPVDESLVLIAQGLARLLDASGLGLPRRPVSVAAPWRPVVQAAAHTIN